MENVGGKNTRRKHLSKNKKKSWRKVDIKDVEEFLEDERLQERTGGIIADKANESLFFVDKKSEDPTKILADRRSRKRAAQERLHDLEIALQPPPPKKKDKRAAAVIEKEASGKLTKTRTESIQKRKAAKRERGFKQRDAAKLPEAKYDLWGGDQQSEQKDDDHFLEVTRKKQVKAPAHLREPTSLVPAVEIPHPGASYNPGYEEYQDLLKKAHITEEKKLQEEERIKRALDSKFPSAADAPTEATNLLEMSAGLFDEDSDNDTAPGDLEKLSVNPPVRRENKKDERRRKKEKARKEKLEAAKRQKEKRIKDNNFNRLRSIKREIKAEEAESEVKAKKRAEQRAQEAFKTKRLSKNKFVEPDLEVKLSDELVGSLRELRPEGHLLLDRFNSLMKRNMLEPRGAPGRKQKRKYKPRVFEKKSHKDVK
ncbi:ribosome biogenesis protein NOP53-like isoform X2 [Dreissena polymorpha]|nr:ribosome biogenesis protein NOP53-like isoform X2 [Dreissena polymorpha]